MADQTNRVKDAAGVINMKQFDMVPENKKKYGHITKREWKRRIKCK